MDCPEKFQETQLPPIEMFHSSLNNEQVNKRQYNNAQKIWDKFQINNEPFAQAGSVDWCIAAKTGHSYSSCKLPYMGID